MNDQAIEKEIQAKGLTAPRIKPEDIEANIAGEYFFTAEQAVSGFNAARLIASLDGNYRRTSPLMPEFRSRKARGGHLEPISCTLAKPRKCLSKLSGESACASPENFDAELGRKIARQNAVAKVWPLMGYELRSQLAWREGPMTGEQIGGAE